MKHFFNKKHRINNFLSRMMLIAGLIISTNTFAFTSMDGKQDDISNHVGKNKWTIIEVWESSCQMCRKHMPEMVEFDGKLKNAHILGISIDGQQGIDDAEDFIAEFDIKFPNLLTNPIEMNVWMQQNIGEPLIGTPTFILFDPKGKLVAAQPGVVSTESLETFIVQNSGSDQPKTPSASTTTETTKNTSKANQNSNQAYAYDGATD